MNKIIQQSHKQDITMNVKEISKKTQRSHERINSNKISI